MARLTWGPKAHENDLPRLRSPLSRQSETRQGDVKTRIIAELAQIPAEQFGFQPVPESRSVVGIIHHIVEVKSFRQTNCADRIRISSECRFERGMPQRPIRAGTKRS